MPEHHPSPDFSHSATPASHILDMAQSIVDLPPQVEARKQTLVHEVLELCHKNGLSHPKELETSPLASKIPFEDLERLLACVTKLEYIVGHRELPQEREIDTEYTMDLPPRSTITDMIDDHGFPVFVTKGRTISVMHPFGTSTMEDKVKQVELATCQGKIVLVITDNVGFSIQDLQGNNVGALTEVYEDVSVKKHKIACVTPFHKAHANFPVDPDGQIIGRPEGYHSASDFPVIRIRETSYFLAFETSHSKSFHVYDDHGKQIDLGGYCANLLLEREGELILRAKKGGKEFLIYPDGSLLEEEPPEGFKEIWRQIVAEDSIYFIEKSTGDYSSPDEWALKDQKGHCLARGKQPDMLHNFLAMQKVGSEFFLHTADSMYRVTKEGETELLEDVNIFPVLVGHTLILARSINDEVSVSKKGGKSFCTFDQIFALEPIDDHRFYVIAKEGDQIQKRVFNITDIA